MAKTKGKMTEQKFHRYLRKNEIKIGKYKMNIVDNEVSIHRAHSVFTKDLTLIPVNDEEECTTEESRLSLKGSFGRIDVVFYYRSKAYCGEIKCTQSQTQFFDALKVLGYTEYYNWENDTNFKPAIIIPFDKITIEHQIMAGRLKILLIGFKEGGDGYKLMEVGDTPIWKQNI